MKEFFSEKVMVVRGIGTQEPVHLFSPTINRTNLMGADDTVIPYRWLVRSPNHQGNL